jgi:hypothetical protein
MVGVTLPITLVELFSVLKCQDGQEDQKLPLTPKHPLKPSKYAIPERFLTGWQELLPLESPVFGMPGLPRGMFRCNIASLAELVLGCIRVLFVQGQFLPREQ